MSSIKWKKPDYQELVEKYPDIVPEAVGVYKKGEEWRGIDPLLLTRNVGKIHVSASVARTRPRSILVKNYSPAKSCREFIQSKQIYENCNPISCDISAAHIYQHNKTRDPKNSSLQLKIPTKKLLVKTSGPAVDTKRTSPPKNTKKLNFIKINPEGKLPKVQGVEDVNDPNSINKMKKTSSVTNIGPAPAAKDSNHKDSKINKEERENEKENENENDTFDLIESNNLTKLDQQFEEDELAKESMKMQTASLDDANRDGSKGAKDMKIESGLRARSHLVDKITGQRNRNNGGKGDSMFLQGNVKAEDKNANACNESSSNEAENDDFQVQMDNEDIECLNEEYEENDDDDGSDDGDDGDTGDGDGGNDNGLQDVNIENTFEGANENNDEDQNEEADQEGNEDNEAENPEENEPEIPTEIINEMEAAENEINDEDDNNDENQGEDDQDLANGNGGDDDSLGKNSQKGEGEVYIDLSQVNFDKEDKMKDGNSNDEDNENENDDFQDNQYDDNNDNNENDLTLHNETPFEDNDDDQIDDNSEGDDIQVEEAEAAQLNQSMMVAQDIDDDDGGDDGPGDDGPDCNDLGPSNDMTREFVGRASVLNSADYSGMLGTGNGNGSNGNGSKDNLNSGPEPGSEAADDINENDTTFQNSYDNSVGNPDEIDESDQVNQQLNTLNEMMNYMEAIEDEDENDGDNENNLHLDVSGMGQLGSRASINNTMISAAGLNTTENEFFNDFSFIANDPTSPGINIANDQQKFEDTELMDVLYQQNQSICRSDRNDEILSQPNINNIESNTCNPNIYMGMYSSSRAINNNNNTKINKNYTTNDTSEELINKFNVSLSTVSENSKDELDLSEFHEMQSNEDQDEFETGEEEEESGDVDDYSE